MKSREDDLLLKLEGLYEVTRNPLFIWYALHRIDFQSRPLPAWIDAYLKRAASYWHRYGFEGEEDGPAGLLDVAGTPVIPGEGVGPVYADTPRSLEGMPLSVDKASDYVARSLELIRAGWSAFARWQKDRERLLQAQAIALDQKKSARKKIVYADEAARTGRTSRTVQSATPRARRLGRAANAKKADPEDA